MTTLPAATLAGSTPVSWSGTDDSSGVASYDVQYRRAAWNAGFGGWQQPAGWAATTQTSSTLALDAGNEYCVRVRATDVAGNVGAWSAATCIARALDDSTLTANKSWARRSGSHFYLGTITDTRTQGVALRLPNAQLRQIGIVATVCQTCGRVQIRVGNLVVATKSLQATRYANRKVFLFTPPFSLRKRWVNVTTMSNKLVRIDGIVIRRA